MRLHDNVPTNMRCVYSQLTYVSQRGEVAETIALTTLGSYPGKVLPPPKLVRAAQWWVMDRLKRRRAEALRDRKQRVAKEREEKERGIEASRKDVRDAWQERQRIHREKAAARRVPKQEHAAAVIAAKKEVREALSLAIQGRPLANSVLRSLTARKKAAVRATYVDYVGGKKQKQARGRSLLFKDHEQAALVACGFQTARSACGWNGDVAALSDRYEEDRVFYNASGQPSWTDPTPPKRPETFAEEHARKFPPVRTKYVPPLFPSETRSKKGPGKAAKIAPSPPTPPPPPSSTGPLLKKALPKREMPPQPKYVDPFYRDVQGPSSYFTRKKS